MRPQVLSARPAAAFILAAALSLTAAACSSAGTGTAPDPASASAARASQSSVAAVQSQIAKEVASQSAAASPSPSGICTTHACIVDDLQKSLVGGIAADEAVATKVTCYKRTVRFHSAADTYSAWCVVTYSDGSSATGTGNLLVSARKVTFQPAGT